MGNTPLGEGQASMPQVDPFLSEPGWTDVADQSSSSADPLGHALFEYQGKRYVVTFFPDQLIDGAHFEQLLPVTWAMAVEGNLN